MPWVDHLKQSLAAVEGTEYGLVYKENTAVVGGTALHVEPSLLQAIKLHYCEQMSKC